MSDQTSPSGGARFWLLSLGLHLALLGALFLTPLREIVMPEQKPPERPDIDMRDRKLEEVVEKIRLSEAEALAQRVALLEAGAQRMATNEQTFRNRFKPFEQAQREGAVEALRQSMPLAITRLELLHQLCTDAAEGHEAAIGELAEEGRLLIAQVMDAQEDIRRGILLAYQLDEAMHLRQKKLDERVYNAEQHVRWFVEGHAKAIDLQTRINELRDQREKEVQGRNRSGVLAAIDARIADRQDKMAAARESRQSNVRAARNILAPALHGQKQLVADIRERLDNYNPFATP